MHDVARAGPARPLPTADLRCAAAVAAAAVAAAPPPRPSSRAWRGTPPHLAALAAGQRLNTAACRRLFTAVMAATGVEDAAARLAAAGARHVRDNDVGVAGGARRRRRRGACSTALAPTHHMHVG